MCKTVAKIIAKDILDAWGNETNRVQTILLSGGDRHYSQRHLNKNLLNVRSVDLKYLMSHNLATY